MAVNFQVPSTDGTTAFISTQKPKRDYKDQEGTRKRCQHRPFGPPEAALPSPRSVKASRSRRGRCRGTHPAGRPRRVGPAVPPAERAPRSPSASPAAAGPPGSAAPWAAPSASSSASSPATLSKENRARTARSTTRSGYFSTYSLSQILTEPLGNYIFPLKKWENWGTEMGKDPFTSFNKYLLNTYEKPSKVIQMHF